MQVLAIWGPSRALSPEPSTPDSEPEFRVVRLVRPGYAF